MDHQKENRQTVSRKTAKRWSAEEDATLRELVVGSGMVCPFSVWSHFLLTVWNAGDEAINWVDVSSHLSGRISNDSRRRWTKIRNSFNKGIWSPDEDEGFYVAVELFS